MDFYSYLKSIEVLDRDIFAAACGTTYARLRQIAYGNEPASPELCVAIDRESKGAVAYATVNDRWCARSGPSDGRKRIPMDWEYVESRAKGEAIPIR